MGIKPLYIGEAGKPGVSLEMQGLYYLVVYHHWKYLLFLYDIKLHRDHAKLYQSLFPRHNKVVGWYIGFMPSFRLSIRSHICSKYVEMQFWVVLALNEKLPLKGRIAAVQSCPTWTLLSIPFVHTKWYANWPRKTLKDTQITTLFNGQSIY